MKALVLALRVLTPKQLKFLVKFTLCLEASCLLDLHAPIVADMISYQYKAICDRHIQEALLRGKC